VSDKKGGVLLMKKDAIGWVSEVPSRGGRWGDI